MTQDAYVSYQVAYLLKEKGFNEPCHCFYEKDKLLYDDMREFYPEGMTNSDHDKEGDVAVSAPTHQMAHAWLMDRHSILISPYALSLGWYFEIFSLKERDITGCKPLFKVGIPAKEECFSTYQEALDNAIQYCCLILIK